MNKVWLLPANENWICDELTKTWSEGNKDITVLSPYDADVIWLFSDWRWRELPIELLKSKKVITTVHHIVPEKWDHNARHDFAARDLITDVYHVYNQRALDFIRPLTNKRIELIHYWADQNAWRPSLEAKNDIRKRLGLPTNAFCLFSAQRDTEGSGISQGIFLPKLEKGPDKFCDYVKTLCSQRSHVHVVLAGWRRQYVIQTLKSVHVPYTYFERPLQETVRDLYQCCDLYAITSRHEGGPQALIETGLMGLPVVSTPVGIAEQVLPQRAINDDVSLATPAVPNVESWKLPMGFEHYRALMGSL